MMIFGQAGTDFCDLLALLVSMYAKISRGLLNCDGRECALGHPEFICALHDMYHILLTVSRIAHLRLMIEIVSSCLLWNASSSVPSKFPHGSIGPGCGTSQGPDGSLRAYLLHVPQFVNPAVCGQALVEKGGAHQRTPKNNSRRFFRTWESE